MNEVLAISYKPVFLGVSILVAILGSFVGLIACSRVAMPNGRISWYDATAAGISIGGVAVWAMHFVGMLAIKFDLGHGYAMVETIISLVAAILVATLAIGYVAKAPHEKGRLLTAGIALGMGVVVMHYLGMMGMRFAGVFVWNWSLVALSVVIAVVAATAAMWLVFRTNSTVSRIGAALVMGAAVCAMHYTGMAAADIVCTTANRLTIPQGFDVVPSFRLNVIVIFISLLMLAFIAAEQFFVSIHKKVQNV
jgi:NO-binding membrane sensor protein with MHYT domain